MTFIHWLCSFLTDCRARVQLHNDCSSSHRFNQGLPQGSVLAPLFFLFCINNLTENLSDDAVIALFADDVSIHTTVRKKEDYVASPQLEVNKVYDWSRKWKLNLNAEKANVALFLPGPVTANGTLHSPLEDNKSELMSPLGYLALSFTEAFCLTLILNPSNNPKIKTSSNCSYCTCFLGLAETSITNYFPLLGLLQAWLRRTSMANLALQHQHNQLGSSLKSSSTFDYRVTTFYSIWSPSCWIRHPKLLNQKQMYDCLSQGEMSLSCSWPSNTNYSTEQRSWTHCHPRQFLP